MDLKLEASVPLHVSGVVSTEGQTRGAAALSKISDPTHQTPLTREQNSEIKNLMRRNFWDMIGVIPCCTHTALKKITP